MDPRARRYVLPGAFDFGDDWWHQINVEGIGQKPARGKYPRVAKKVGKSPPQYADLDQDEDEEDEEAEAEDRAAGRMA